MSTVAEATVLVIVVGLRGSRLSIATKKWRDRREVSRLGRDAGERRTDDTKILFEKSNSTNKKRHTGGASYHSVAVEPTHERKHTAN